MINEKLNVETKELTKQDELDKEGKEQKNCVLTYLGDCAENIVRIVSLDKSKGFDTDHYNKKITIEIVYRNNAVCPIQIKGYKNKKVAQDKIEAVFELLNQNQEQYFNPEVLQKLKENQYKPRIDSGDDGLIVHYQQIGETQILENMFKNILENVNKLKNKNQKKTIQIAKEIKI